MITALSFGLFVYLVIGGCVAGAVTKVYKIGEDGFGDVKLSHAIYVALSFLFWPITMPALWSLESILYDYEAASERIFVWKNVRPDGSATIALACERTADDARRLIASTDEVIMGPPMYTSSIKKPLLVHFKVDVSDA